MRATWRGVSPALCLFVSLAAGCRQERATTTSAHVASPVPRASPDSRGLRFVDVTAAAGIHYEWTVPGARPLNILQTIGNGAAFLDFDGDHNLDVLLVGPALALYHGDGHGHFADVTQAAGLDVLHGNFLGAAVGDYDNDGYADVYICAYRGGLLLHNEHGTRFADVTSAAGLKPQPWGTTAAFVDLDGRGRLSLYVGNYAVFGPETRPQLCLVGGTKTACGPNAYRPEYGVLYQNLGGGRFDDVTARWKAQKVSGRALGAAVADYDGSGRQSLYLANDEMPGDLLKNEGGGFKNIGASSGTAYDANGNLHGGMGADWGDYDNDGRLDLVVATFEKEPKTIYRNEGGDLFTDESAALGVAQRTLPYVAFGAKWLDADNDTWLDLLITNGHTQDNVATMHPETSYRQPTQLFRNDRGARFDDASTALAEGAGRPIVGRGLAIGDYDNDGRMDALLVDSDGSPLLLHNETTATGHWLEVDLVGTRSSRDGQGTLVTLEVAGRRLLRSATTAGSYLSASDPRVHIGLGDAALVTRATLRWPSGRTDVYDNVKADQIVTWREGAAPVR
jgi:enediyne biosynthesis protein E4